MVVSAGLELEQDKRLFLSLSSSMLAVETPSGPLSLNAVRNVVSDSAARDSCHPERSDLLKLQLRARQVLLPILHRDDLLDKEDDIDYLDEYFDELPHDRLANNKENPIGSEVDKAILDGTDQFLEEYKNLCYEFEKRFCTSLGKEPARI